MKEVHEFECLQNIDKDQIREMSFEELKVLVEQISQEEWLEKTKQRLLAILDVRDAGVSEPRIIEAEFEKEDE